MKNLLLIAAILIGFSAYSQQEIILIGTSPNDGTGDKLRTAFIKCNDNFTELYPVKTIVDNYPDKFKTDTLILGSDTIYNLVLRNDTLYYNDQYFTVTIDTLYLSSRIDSNSTHRLITDGSNPHITTRVDTSDLSLDSDSLNSKSPDFYADTLNAQNLYGEKDFKDTIRYDIIDANTVLKVSPLKGVANSQIYDNDTSVAIGTVTPTAKFEVDNNDYNKDVIRINTSEIDDFIKVENSGKLVLVGDTNDIVEITSTTSTGQVSGDASMVRGNFKWTGASVGSISAFYARSSGVSSLGAFGFYANQLDAGSKGYGLYGLTGGNTQVNVGVLGKLIGSTGNTSNVAVQALSLCTTITTDVFGLHGQSSSSNTTHGKRLIGVCGQGSHNSQATNGISVGGLFTAFNGSLNYALLTDQGLVGFGTTSPTAKVHIEGDDFDGSTISFLIDDSNNDTVFYIKDNGYAKFKNVVELEDQIIYTDTYWNELSIPAVRSKLGLLDKPDFDYNDLTLLYTEDDSTEIAYYSEEMHHAWKTGTSLYPHLEWVQASSDTVNFRMKYRIQEPGQARVSTWIYINTATTQYYTYTSGTLNQIARFPAIDMTGKVASSIIEFQIYRIDDGGVGFVSGDVSVSDIGIHFEIDKPGSDTEVP